jgi:hypothetical protein
VMKPRQAQGWPLVALVGCATHERAPKDLINEAERGHVDGDLNIKHLYLSMHAWLCLVGSPFGRGSKSKATYTRPLNTRLYGTHAPVPASPL